MRKIWILAIFSLMTTASIFGSEAEKLYINLDQVVFDHCGIWVENEGSFFEVDGIHFDKLENKYTQTK